MNPDTTEPCFVVLRADEGRVTVKLVVWSVEEADQQVARLNELNAAKGCRYHWEKSRASRRPSPGVPAPRAR